MSDINTHIQAAKAFLLQKKLNHALDSIVAAIEILAEPQAVVEPDKDGEPVKKITASKKSKVLMEEAPDAKTKGAGSRTSDIAATEGSITS